MGRNSICVIYDSDENYAKRLMSVINDDNDIPYNAQVFTQEQELDKYLQEKKADMLMICEGAYEYDATRTGNKTVVLCEEEQDADEINSKEERGLVGICKYQPSYQLLQSVMRYEKRENNRRSVNSQVVVQTELNDFGKDDEEIYVGKAEQYLKERAIFLNDCKIDGESSPVATNSPEKAIRIFNALRKLEIN